MPTKHKRKRNPEDDKSHYDLPPSSRAKPLPVIEPTKDFLTARPTKRQKPSSSKTKHNKTTTTDDTPKTFARLMAWHKDGKKLRSGLDNGETPKQKRKQQRQQKTKQIQAQQQQLTQPEETQSPDKTTSTTDQSQPTTTTQTQTQPAPPPPLKILPGESLTSFSIRVDQSLPLTQITQSSKPTSTLPSDLRTTKPLTKHNKRLARMQADWRKTEARLLAKEEEALEDQVETLEEEKLLWDSVKTVGKKGKRKVVVDEDPWAELEKRRGAETRQKNLQDVVVAPPVLTGVKNIFKQQVGTRPRQPVDLGVVRSTPGRKIRRKDEVAAIRKGALHAARTRAISTTA